MEKRKWVDLNVDCLANIFGRLGLEERTLSLPFVCKSWFHASLSPNCWRSLDFRALDFYPSSSFVRRFMRSYRLSSFSFTGFLKFAVHRSQGSALELMFPLQYATVADLAYVSAKCPALRVLVLPTLYTNEDFVDENLANTPELISRFKNLEQLYMLDSNWPAIFKEILAQISHNCSNFSGLHLRPFIYDDLAIIPALFPKIKCLDLTMSWVNKKDLMTILERCRELGELNLKDCTGFLVDDEILKSASHIKKFSFEGVSMFRDDEPEWHRNTDDGP